MKEQQSKRGRWSSIVLVAATLAAGGGVVAWKYAAAEETAGAAATAEPAAAVTEAVAEPREHRGSTTAIGTVLATRSVTLRNEVPGTVRRTNLTPGQVVEEGTVLVALDVSVEEAELEALQARAELASSTLARLQRLAERRAVSAIELDNARAERDVAVAEIERIRAVIERRTIRAPFRARVGIADVHPGQFLDAGTLLTTLQGVDDAVHVDFEVAQSVAAGLATGEAIDVFVGDAGEPVPARIVAVDARIDPTTRNALVRARIDDLEGRVSPGASVRVRVPVGAPRTVVVVPVSALRKGPGGDHVFVLDAQSGQTRAHMRQVEAGPTLGDEVVILRGLEAGERVAAAGSFKLREGMLVSVAPEGSGARGAGTPDGGATADDPPADSAGSPAAGADLMRSFTDVFIKHPVLAVVVNLVILLVGWRALRSLPVQQYPQVESSSVVITTVYYGASAETVRGFLTTPIERAVSAISGVDYIESQSRAGVSTVTVRLKLDHNTTAALAEVTARLQQVRAELPPDAEPPMVDVQRADRPYATFYLAFNSPERTSPEVTDWLMRTIQPELSTLPGVQRVTIEGGRQIAMRVWIDPDRLAALNLTPGDVHAALQRNNYLAAVGQTKGDLVQVNLLANTDLRSEEEFAELIVAERNGAIVRLSDVARVELGAEEADFVAKYNDEESVYLGIWPLVGSNEIDVAHELYAAMERLEPTLPPDVEMHLAYDGTSFMQDALSEITKTLGETMLIVALVVFVFLGSVRTAIVPLVAMPLSLVGAAILMLALGFSLNLLTILAIVLSVGIVVDDAIVVVENVERHIRLGKSRIEAALASARELVGPIIAMTITLATVYTPIAFQGGLTGSLFLEFAVTLAAAVVVSGFVALTLSPIMSARFLHEHGREGRLTALVNRGFDGVRRRYERMLDGALAMRWGIVAASLLVAAAAWPLYTSSRKELAPIEDQGHIALFMQSAPDASLPAVNAASMKVVNTITSLPEAEFMWSVVAPWGGFGGMVTKEWTERERSTEEMYGQVYGAVSQVPGLQVFPRLDPPLPTPGQYDVELVLQSDGPPEQMLETVGAVIGAGWQSGKFLYVDTDLKIDLPQARVVLDRERIADLGLDLASVGRELGTLLGGGYVNRFNYYNRSYKVIPQIEAESRTTVAPLLDLKIRTPEGELVPVSTFTHIESTSAPRSLNRFQQRNAVRVFGGVQPGVTKDEGLRVLEAAAEAAAGPGITLDYAGESRQIRLESNRLAGTLGFAVILIYLVLSAQFRSFRDPLIVLVGSVPLAISGALIFSYLDFTTINIYSQVGLITLVGLIAKNGILIVEFANTLQRRGLAKMEALKEASLTRLRPVLMTSVATVFGHLPLVFVSGPGSEARNSIGTVLVSGMIVGTLFTMFVVPVFYSLIAADHAPAAVPAAARKEAGAPVLEPVHA